MLERYLTIRQMYPHWFQKLDPLDPKIAAVIDAGYLLPLPKRDAEGRRIVLSCMGTVFLDHLLRTYLIFIEKMFAPQ